MYVYFRRPTYKNNLNLKIYCNKVPVNSKTGSHTNQTDTQRYQGSVPASNTDHNSTVTNQPSQGKPQSASTSTGTKIISHRSKPNKQLANHPTPIWYRKRYQYTSTVQLSAHATVPTGTGNNSRQQKGNPTTQNSTAASQTKRHSPQQFQSYVKLTEKKGVRPLPETATRSQRGNRERSQQAQQRPGATNSTRQQDHQHHTRNGPKQPQRKESRAQSQPNPRVRPNLNSQRQQKREGERARIFLNT